ncbi:hypothetical protein C0995_014513 [Termitomyces sp. Mi166|nr:hypothetical protein C0995_014513 [Termitomyces sp. Mi166\
MYGVNSNLSGNWKRRTELVDYCVRVVDQSLKEKRSVVEDGTQDSATKRKMQGHIFEEQVKLLPFLSVAPIAASASRLPSIFSQNRPEYNFNAVKVPVQLGVMSRCPDALLCENVFDDVLQKVSNKIDISMVYVARLDPQEEVFGVRCMHGPEECAGNVQQLCVAKYESAAWWEFVQCQNYEGRNEIGNPDLALRCANTVGIDWEKSRAGTCAGLDGSGKGSEGVALMKESIKLGQKLGIEKSCTILINGNEVCVHDGTWKNCENGHGVNDFVRQINEAYDRLNAA